ncbi:MAG TPA: sensor domain-containing diguanylate cyclase [Paenibacillus sp.]|jgi:diguanylate cyclase (GGDEF)-like protein/PAS domain S-box-containing protein
MMNRVHDVHSKNNILLKILSGFYMVSLGGHLLSGGGFADLSMPLSIGLGSVIVLFALCRRYPVVAMLLMICSPYLFLLSLMATSLNPLNFILLGFALLVSLIYLDIRLVMLSGLLYLITATYWSRVLFRAEMVAGSDRSDLLYAVIFDLYMMTFSWVLINLVKGRWSKSEHGLTSLNHILENIDITTWVYDLGSSRLSLSPGITRLTGLPADTFTDFRSLLELVDPADIPLVQHSQKEMIIGRREVLLECRLRRMNGDICWVQVRGTPHLNEQGHLVHLEGVLIDITESKEREKRMEYLAYHDDLTGLPNRAFFHMRLRQFRSDGANNKALMFIDLDNFKEVNDTYGHHVGDKLLQEIAKRLFQQIRESDLICRLGGDEFLILLSNSDEKHASTVAQRIIASLAVPFYCNQHPLQATASIGIYCPPDDCEDLDQMIHLADEAMYEAKRSGRNQYAVNPSLT